MLRCEWRHAGSAPVRGVRGCRALPFSDGCNERDRAVLREDLLVRDTVSSAASARRAASPRVPRQSGPCGATSAAYLARNMRPRQLGHAFRQRSSRISNALTLAVAAASTLARQRDVRARDRLPQTNVRAEMFCRLHESFARIASKTTHSARSIGAPRCIRRRTENGSGRPM